MNRMDHHYDASPPANTKPAPSKASMQGFDAEFTDIVDYILRITYRIWEGKQVGLCHDYYSDDCPIYTLAGVFYGAEVVTQNTVSTLAAFPDRTLHADNIIWGGNDQQGFYSSHLISSHMTNLGESEFGPATGKAADIQVIAHCVVKDNKVIEEWLVRDNLSLAEQLGFDPHEIAKQWASKPLSDNNPFVSWRQSEIDRVLTQTSLARSDSPADAQQDPEAFIRHALQNIWNARMLGDAFQFYAPEAQLKGLANRQLQGPEAIISLYTGILGALPDARCSVDYVCSIPYTDEKAGLSGIDIAARWTLAGTHTGRALYGEPCGEKILIIGESHYRVIDNKVVEETTIFDELAILTQIYRARAVNDVDSSVN